jgi:hypothetical protein
VGSSPASATEGATSSRTSIQKVLPLPTVLSTPMAPPISSTRRFATTRPMPVPSSTPLSRPSRLKGSKRCVSISGVRPAPVSSTKIRTSPWAVGPHPTTTSPSIWLYLMAFDRRLMSTCFMRVRSTLTNMGAERFGNVIVSPRRWA